MEASQFVELFDSCWFEREIFKKQSGASKSSSSEGNPDRQNQEEGPKPEAWRAPTMITRSMSEQLCPNFDYPFSPDSVLQTTKLHTILFSKEITEEEEEEEETENPVPMAIQRSRPRELPKEEATGSRRGGKKATSKSLSELEFEELKGFMDLGFVFSEEDKDSSLVSILPGLQRLGKKDGEEKISTVADESTVPRPYLSEAWEALERRRKEKPLMNWRIPALSNENDMKDHLKWWAHTVASAVR